MEVEVAEQKLKAMAHSEQHYFKRFVAPFAHGAPASIEEYPS